MDTHRRSGHTITSFTEAMVADYLQHHRASSNQDTNPLILEEETFSHAQTYALSVHSRLVTELIRIVTSLGRIHPRQPATSPP